MSYDVIFLDFDELLASENSHTIYVILGVHNV